MIMLFSGPSGGSGPLVWVCAENVIISDD